jgi:anti-anti-sigma regulatory factor
VAAEWIAEGGTLRLRLWGAVDIFDASIVAAGAREAAIGGSDVTVSLEAAESVDTSVTQVLIALRRALDAGGRSFRVNAPPAIATAWRQAGLADELGLPGE